jgi:hypothetical protein
MRRMLISYHAAVRIYCSYSATIIHKNTLQTMCTLSAMTNMHMLDPTPQIVMTPMHSEGINTTQ